MRDKDTTTSSNDPEPEMLEEYDFSTGIRGKYAARYAAGTNLILLAPDVAEAFPDSDAVNDALRELLKSRTSPANGRSLPQS